MSGSIMAGGGVNAQIPLETGAQQTNPLASTGQLVNTLSGINQLKLFPGQMQLQQQQIQGGAASLAAHLNQVGASMLLPTIANPNFSMDDVTRGAGALEHAGGSSQGVLGILGAIPFAPNTPEWRTAFKQGLASLAQTSPESAVAQIAGTPINIPVGNQIVSGVQQPAVAGGGVSQATSTPIGIAPQLVKRAATQADVDAGRASEVGQEMTMPYQQPATPAGGGYGAPQRPLNQLGGPYRPAGGVAPPAPGGAPPGVPPPGTRLMTAPDGSRGYVPVAQVPTFMQHGYR